MIAIAPQVRVYLHRRATDMRKSFNGLVALIESAMEQDPLTGSLFVFLNQRRDRMKILYWGQTGFCIWYTQLQVGTFQPPAGEPGDARAALEITRTQLSLILDGIDLSSAKQRPRFKLGS